MDATPDNFFKNKQVCEQPAYLFWKLQSRLIKLNQKLNKLTHPERSHLDRLKTQKIR